MNAEERDPVVKGRNAERSAIAPPAGAAVPLVRVENVAHAYGATQVLDGVSLDIARGEFFTLLGPSGCGKTTLLRLIAGFEQVSAGRITMDRQDLARLPAEKRPINTVFQSYALFPHLTVAENVGFGLRMQGRPRAEIGARVAEMLDLVRLSDLAGRRVTQLSGGQQQRVALARALAPKPKMLLLDEPLGALDHKLRQDMQVELKRIQRSLGMTFLFVTHDQEEALSMSDRIAIMRGGRLLQCDAPHAIYCDPVDGFVASFLGEANFLSGRLRVVEHGRAGVEIGGHMVSIPLSRPVCRPGEVTMMVRPENIRVGAHDGVRLAGQLETRSFLGPDQCLHLRLPDGTAIRVRARGDEAPHHLQPGQQLTITIPPRHLRLMGGA